MSILKSVVRFLVIFVGVGALFLVLGSKPVQAATSCNLTITPASTYNGTEVSVTISSTNDNNTNNYWYLQVKVPGSTNWAYTGAYPYINVNGSYTWGYTPATTGTYTFRAAGQSGGVCASGTTLTSAAPPAPSVDNDNVWISPNGGDMWDKPSVTIHAPGLNAGKVAVHVGENSEEGPEDCYVGDAVAPSWNVFWTPAQGCRQPGISHKIKMIPHRDGYGYGTARYRGWLPSNYSQPTLSATPGHVGPGVGTIKIGESVTLYALNTTNATKVVVKIDDCTDYIGELTAPSWSATWTSDGYCSGNRIAGTTPRKLHFSPFNAQYYPDGYGPTIDKDLIIQDYTPGINPGTIGFAPASPYFDQAVDMAATGNGETSGIDVYSYSTTAGTGDALSLGTIASTTEVGGSYWHLNWPAHVGHRGIGAHKVMFRPWKSYSLGGVAKTKLGTDVTYPSITFYDRNPTVTDAGFAPSAPTRYTDSTIDIGTTVNADTTSIKVYQYPDNTATGARVLIGTITADTLVAGSGWHINWASGTGYRAADTPYKVRFIPYRNAIEYDANFIDRSITFTTRPAPSMNNALLIGPSSSVNGTSLTVTQSANSITNTPLWDFWLNFRYNGTHNEYVALGRGGAAGAAIGSTGSITKAFTPTNNTTSAAVVTLMYGSLGAAAPTAEVPCSIGACSVSYTVIPAPTITGAALNAAGTTLTITGTGLRTATGTVTVNGALIPGANIASWADTTITVSPPPLSGTVNQVCLGAPFTGICVGSTRTFRYETDGAWWQFRTTPPPTCSVTPAPTRIQARVGQPTSLSLTYSWSNWDSTSPITTTFTGVPAGITITSVPPMTPSAGVPDGASVQTSTVTINTPPATDATIGITATSPIATCTTTSFVVSTIIDPFLKTTGGDVHSNTRILTPGGP